MKRFHCLQFAALCAGLLGQRAAFAQPAPPPEAPPPAAPGPVVLAPPPAPITPPPAAAAPPASPPTLAAAAAAPVAAPAAADHWYDRFQTEGFVDAYASVNYNFPAAQAGANGFRAYDVNNGAALHWIGLNLTYPASPIGGTVGLRFGPSATLYAATDASINLASIKQAFASWKPGGAESKLTLDFGKYDAPFGSEVADSQGNMSYTRSMLYWYAQPAFLTGFRVDYAPVDAFDIKLFAVNGWNNTLDNNAGKSFGVQLMFKPADQLVAYAGYMFGPEQSDTRAYACPPGTSYSASAGACVLAPGAVGGSGTAAISGVNTRFRHLVDLVVDVNPTRDVRLLFNATYAHDRVADGPVATRPVSFYGGNLGARYAFNDVFSLAARGEVYWDPDGYSTGTGKFTRVVDGTLTVAAAPSEHLLIKLDGRADVANEPFFLRRDAGSSAVQVTTTLGVVVTTGVLSPFALSR